LGYHTKAIHAGLLPNALTGAIIEPIYQCSVYAQSNPGEFKYDYGRSMNPNYYPLEEALAALEYGKYATVVSSGVGAMTAVITLLKAGDTVIMPTDVYGGTYRLFKQMFEKFGVSFQQLDLNNLAAVENALRKNVQMVYIESPTNPLLTIYDLATLSALARRYGALTVVDNTFASPYFQNPLKLGIDIVLHSASKYIGGHSDIVGGAVITNNADIRNKIDFARKTMGLHIDPFTMFLMRRGMKTLPLRMEQHQKNALALAHYFETHPKVEKVLYPGLISHPQYAIAKKQMSGFSGMLTVFFKLSNEQVRRLISSFNIITLAESLGAVESLVEHPARARPAASGSRSPRECARNTGSPMALFVFLWALKTPKT
jgi:cystathionine beta-lyase/cystathionine gamma-synthase